jgi:hypothetical protein
VNESDLPYWHTTIDNDPLCSLCWKPMFRCHNNSPIDPCREAWHHVTPDDTHAAAWSPPTRKQRYAYLLRRILRSLRMLGGDA